MRKDLLIITLLILPAVAPLLQRGYFTMHDDLQSMRQLEMNKCITDGQIPCRWVLDMGYGYGYPLFNYYPPLPYLVGQVYRFMGFSYIDIVKLVGITGFIVTAVGMYLLGREFWGRGGGLISSLLYTYAPYHSVDFYVRGAMNEFWAMAFYPYVFLFTYKLIHASDYPSAKLRKWIPLVSLSLAGIMLSHNPMLMIFTPFYLGWIVLWWWRTRSVKSFKYLFISGIWALGLAAFFTLPVLFEQKYAHVETLVIGYFNYLAHFLDLRQIFFRINWGYGSSVLGPGDTMSFALGYLQWLIPLALLLLLPFSRHLKKYFSVLIFLIISILLSLFMTHSKSTFVWMALKPLEFLQFPWRFLTLAVFFSSFLGGAVYLLFNKINRLSILAYSLILVFIILLNANYFHPDKWLPNMTDAQKFSGKSWQYLVTSGIFDYLPKSAPFPPADPAGSDALIVSGSAEIFTLNKKTNYQVYAVNARTPATVQIQTFYFPGWQVFVDNQMRAINPLRDKLLGRIIVDVPAGPHQITARFTNTPVRTLGNVLSLAAWLSLIIYLYLYGYRSYRWRYCSESN